MRGSGKEDAHGRGDVVDHCGEGEGRKGEEMSGHQLLRIAVDDDRQLLPQHLLTSGHLMTPLPRWWLALWTNEV